jgi:hypothetical protein
MPRRMRALAAALSRRRRRARCSSARSCGRRAGVAGGCGGRESRAVGVQSAFRRLQSCQNLPIRCETAQLVACGCWGRMLRGPLLAPSPGGGAAAPHRGHQVAKLVLLQLLPGMVVLILALKRALTTRLLLGPAPTQHWEVATGSSGGSKCRAGRWRSLPRDHRHLRSSSSSSKSIPRSSNTGALPAIPPGASHRSLCRL